MAPHPPFLYDYDPIRDEKRHSFDPKAVSRASLALRPERPKHEGPLLNFNHHPDSYVILPYGNTNAKPMNPQTRSRIVRMRIIQLLLRCLELLAACGMLVLAILLTHIQASAVWLIRIPAGIAILHTVYSIFHHSRKASKRTAASSASYQLFSAGFDACLIPFYTFDALLGASQYTLSLKGAGQDGEWSSLLAGGQALTPDLSKALFLDAVVAGGLHLISLAISIYLATVFRKIAKLPPDYNPLEENLTSHAHKRNKSSISTITFEEKRLSEPLESKRRSGAPYEDLSRPPTIPFMHTRQGSTDSFSVYSTPPASRDGRADLPSAQRRSYLANKSPHSSVTGPKRQSRPSSPAKHVTYSEVPMSESPRCSQHSDGVKDAWFADPNVNSKPNDTRDRNLIPQSPTKGGRRGNYQPVTQPYDENESDDGEVARPRSSTGPYPHFERPLDTPPPIPRHAQRPRNTAGPALSEIDLNASSDITDHPLAAAQTQPSYDGIENNENHDGRTPERKKSDISFKAKYYGELKARTPPIMIGEERKMNGPSNMTKEQLRLTRPRQPSDMSEQRQVSSGNDFGGRREVSGKVAEEGRAGRDAKGFGARFRKVSGLAFN